jgi:large subunit ribosomal protein L2
MSLRFFRSIGPGGRHAILDFFEGTTRSKSEKKLLQLNHRKFGRDHYGKITCRHRGGGHKRLYRKVDFFRKNLDWVGFVKAIKYDPGRNSRLALISYKDDTKKYILAPKGLRVGQTVVSGFCVSPEVGNSLPLWNIPFGASLHSVELRPGSGRKLSRSAGTSTQLIARKNGLCTVRLPSDEIRLIPETCWATVGQVGNVEVGGQKFGKAGRVRWLGCRSTVRGSVINPVDHPHGGGEGRCPIGRVHPATPWGKPRFGVKTRPKKKYSDDLILLRGKLFFLSIFHGSFVEKRTLYSKTSTKKNRGCG